MTDLAARGLVTAFTFILTLAGAWLLHRHGLALPKLPKALP